MTVGQVGEQVRQHVGDTRFRESFYTDRTPPVFERLTGFSVECAQEECRGGNVDDTTAIDFGIGNTFAVVGTHRVLVTRRCRLTVRPQQFAVRRVECHNVTPWSGNGIQLAVDVARRRTSAGSIETGAVPDPRFLEVLKVLEVDLVGGRVTGMFGVATEISPGTVFSVRRVLDNRCRC